MVCVVLRSPISGRPACGGDALRRYLSAAVAAHGELRYHAVLGVHGENAIVALCDGEVRGSALQLAVVLTLDDRDMLSAVTFLARPWIVTGYLRSAIPAPSAVPETLHV